MHIDMDKLTPQQRGAVLRAMSSPQQELTMLIVKDAPIKLLSVEHGKDIEIGIGGVLYMPRTT